MVLNTEASGSKVSNDEKRMAATVNQTVRPTTFDPGKTGQPSFNPISALLVAQRPALANFITNISWLLFQLVNADTSWLLIEPSLWSTNPKNTHLRDFIQDMQVANDAAEQGLMCHCV